MNTAAMCIAFVLLLPAAALVTWVWWSMAQVEDDLRAGLLTLCAGAQTPAHTGANMHLLSLRILRRVPDLTLESPA